MKHAQAIIRRLTLTEKGSRLSETANQYFIDVATDANKLEIKRAVEEQFKVKVVRVNTLNRRPRIVRDRRGRDGRQAGCKRAIVTLKQGDKIQLA